MRSYSYYFTALMILSIYFPKLAGSADLNGLWTKTKSPDSNNITIFYQEKSLLMAMGYDEIDGKQAVWYAQGEIKKHHFRLRYHDPIDATPGDGSRMGS